MSVRSRARDSSSSSLKEAYWDASIMRCVASCLAAWVGPCANILSLASIRRCTSSLNLPWDSLQVWCLFHSCLPLSSGLSFSTLPLISLQTASSKKLRPQGGIIGVMSTPNGSSRHRRRFSYATHLHTQMPSFQVDSNPMWMKHGVQSICNLLTNPFLYRKTFGEKPYHPGELGNPDDVLMSNVAHISHAVERKGMMLTQRIKGDRSLNDLAEPAVRLAAAFRFKNP